jgi:hypothetical protein
MAQLSIKTLRDGAIHVGEAVAPPVTFAADELRRHLKLLTGSMLPIVRETVLRGANALVIATPVGAPAPPQPEGYRVIPEPERIMLAAASPRLLLDAVYTLLEQLGCRWSLHGTEEEEVPALSGSTIELAAIERTPPFTRRGYTSDIMTWHYTQAEHLHDRLPDDRTFIDWMGKSGANTFFYIRHPFDTQLTIPELLPEFTKRGIDLEYGGHVIPLLLPRDLFAEHPEYFSESPDGVRTEYGNLCTSNSAALATVSGNAVEYAHDYPEMRALHIWGADLWHSGWCHCAACAPLSAQDQSLRVCNAVARGLAAAGVARPVCYLAYHDTLDAALMLRPEANVVAEFAPRERCYGHALNDPACVTNRRYATALERYVELFDGRVRLFEYYGDAILYFGCAVPLTQVITADLAYYERLGIREILMLQFGAFSTWAYPLNFLTFAAATAGLPGLTDCDYSFGRFGRHAQAARAAFVELEDVMRGVVTYGDIRRPPRTPEQAAAVLLGVEAALPRLAALAQRLATLGADWQTTDRRQQWTDEALAAQGALICYTHAVLDAARQDLQDTVAGRPPSAAGQYAETLSIIEAVDRRFKGLWGTVDLPIIHSFFAAAVAGE